MKLKKFLAATTPMYEALFGETSGGAGSPESGARSGDLPVEPVKSDLVVSVVDTGSAI